MMLSWVSISERMVRKKNVVLLVVPVLESKALYVLKDYEKRQE